jgi:hypothetical protein
MGLRLRRTAIAVGAMAAVLVFGPASHIARADGCATNCAVGDLGTGGVSSDGAARGFRYEGPGNNPDYHIVNTGNDIAGHISFSGPTDGSGSGAYTPQGVVVGHYDGAIGPYCNGVCSEAP